jgi:hypothetical protein
MYLLEKKLPESCGIWISNDQKLDGEAQQIRKWSRSKCRLVRLLHSYWYSCIFFNTKKRMDTVLLRYRYKTTVAHHSQKLFSQVIQGKTLPVHHHGGAGGREGIATTHYWPWHYRGWVVSVTPRPCFTPGKGLPPHPVPSGQEAG